MLVSIWATLKVAIVEATSKNDIIHYSGHIDLVEPGV